VTFAPRGRSGSARRQRTIASALGKRAGQTWSWMVGGKKSKAFRVEVEGEGVVVENLATDRCLRVVPDGGQAEALPPAGRTRPRTRSFAVLVDGDLATHELLVSAADGGGLHLREAQRRLLDAYAEPVEHGDLVPTHEEVAAALGLPIAAVRARCHELRGELRLAGVEVRALGDVREEVVDAWTRLPH